MQNIRIVDGVLSGDLGPDEIKFLFPDALNDLQEYITLWVDQNKQAIVFKQIKKMAGPDRQALMATLRAL